MIVTNLNDIIKILNEPIYYTSFYVWLRIIQPETSHAMANPTFYGNALSCNKKTSKINEDRTC